MVTSPGSSHPFIYESLSERSEQPPESEKILSSILALSDMLYKMHLLRFHETTVIASYPLGTIFRVQKSIRSNLIFSIQTLYHFVRLDELNNFSVGHFLEFEQLDDEIPIFRDFSTFKSHRGKFIRGGHEINVLKRCARVFHTR